jgi:L-fuculokinase
LEAVETSGKFKAERIICVGGGSKNNLWNQLRANVCQKPVQLIDQKETTVLGASLFVFYGSKLYQSVHEARDMINYNPQFVLPNTNEINVWEELYQNYRKLKSID